MAKKASPCVSDWLGRHRIVTCLSPGTRKKSGEVGANGSRNFESKIAWATFALSSSEAGTVRTESWVTVWPRKPR